MGQRHNISHPDLPVKLPPAEAVNLPLDLPAEIPVHSGGQQPLIRLPQRDHHLLKRLANLTVQLFPLQGRIAFRQQPPALCPLEVFRQQAGKVDMDDLLPNGEEVEDGNRRRY